MKPNYILKKDLPNCPKGRVFKPTIDGNDYFLSMSDNEAIENKLHSYKFKANVVENNPKWFKKEMKSHLIVQLENAKRRKEYAEYEITELTKKLSKK